MTWSVIGVPIDCIGADEQSLTAFGTELAPAALRELGIVNRVGGEDKGDLDVRIVGRQRDSETGLVGGETVREAVSGIRAGVRELVAAGDRVLLLGGCCIPLMGALAGARDALGEVGLVYIDGHLDLYDHVTSPTGEAADMPTAAVLGIGEPGVLASMDAPVVASERLAIIGAHDPDEWPAVSHLVRELNLHVVEPAAIKADPEAVADVAAERAGRDGRFWVHLDVDVFDQAEFPATDYLMPDGLTLETGRELLQALGADQRLIGVSLGCYNPEKDSGGSSGRELIELARLLTGASNDDHR